jgi:methyl-accepting chemotaxis protein
LFLNDIPFGVSLRENLVPRQETTATLSVYGARETALGVAGSHLANTLRGDAKALGDIAAETYARIDTYCLTARRMNEALERLKQARFSQLELRWSGQESRASSYPEDDVDFAEDQARFRDMTAQIYEQAREASIIARRSGAATRHFTGISREILKEKGINSQLYEQLRADLLQLETEAEKTAAVTGRFEELSSLACQRAGELGRIHETAVMSTLIAAVQSAQDATRAARRIGMLGADMTRRLDRLSARLLFFVRQSLGGERRRFGREACFWGCTIHIGSQPIRGRTLDLSEGGALLLCAPVESVSRGQSVILDLDHIGALQAQVAGCSERGLHVAFDVEHPANAGARQPFLELLQEASLHDVDRVSHVSQLAAHIGEAIDCGLNRGDVSLEDLLSREYIPLANEEILANDETLRVQVPAQAFYDAAVKALLLSCASANAVFVRIIDRNGFIPWHVQYEVAGGITEPVLTQERQLCGSWIILNAARNLRPSLVQISKITLEDPQLPGTHIPSHDRIVKSISVPIFALGRHWGCAEMGFAPEDDGQKTEKS